jgi:2-methylisocitrate lyase-like PEP mutase family enzyme
MPFVIVASQFIPFSTRTRKSILVRRILYRLQAYQEAGADVLYAPGLQTMDDIKAVLSSIDRPMNLLMGFPTSSLTVAEVAALGVRRVSVGGALARAAFGALKRAGMEMLDHGTFNYGKDAMSGKDLNALFKGTV